MNLFSKTVTKDKKRLTQTSNSQISKTIYNPNFQQMLPRSFGHNFRRNNQKNNYIQKPIQKIKIIMLIYIHQGRSNQTNTNKHWKLQN